MDQLTFNVTTNRWNLNCNDPLMEVLKATTDPNMADEDIGEEDEVVCMISGIQIVDTHWTTTRMGGVAGDQDLSSVTSQASTTSTTVIDDNPTVDSGATSNGKTTMYSHQSLGGSTINSDQIMSSQSSASTNNESLPTKHLQTKLLAPNGRLSSPKGILKEEEDDIPKDTTKTGDPRHPTAGDNRTACHHPYYLPTTRVRAPLLSPGQGLL